MQAEVEASESLAALAQLHSIGVTQVITDGPEGTVVYHLQVGDGVASFGPGAAPDEHVRMEQTWKLQSALLQNKHQLKSFLLRVSFKCQGTYNVSLTMHQCSELLTQRLPRCATTLSTCNDANLSLARRYKRDALRVIS